MSYLSKIIYWIIYLIIYIKLLRPLENDIYWINDPLGVRLLNRLCLGFSNLKEHKSRQNFADTLNPLCSCSLETEDTEHYFQRCESNLSFCTTLMNDLNNTAIASLNPNDLLSVILYVDKWFNRETNCKKLTASIKLIKDTHHLEQSLF